MNDLWPTEKNLGSAIDYPLLVDWHCSNCHHSRQRPVVVTSCCRGTSTEWRSSVVHLRYLRECTRGHQIARESAILFLANFEEMKLFWSLRRWENSVRLSESLSYIIFIRVSFSDKNDHCWTLASSSKLNIVKEAMDVNCYSIAWTAGVFFFTKFFYCFYFVK